MRESEIRVGISSCLLGNPVRFDGGHKLDHYLRDTLGAYVAWVPICPEVESGLPDDGTAGGLVKFTTEHKLLVLAHSPRHCSALGKLAAGAGAQGRRPPAALLDAYRATLMEGLRLVATAAKHTNVLQHAAGYFKRLLTPGEKAELGEAIESFRRGLIPLIVPVTLLAHYTTIYGEPWLGRQHYLRLEPRKLMLRNHV